MGLQKHGHVSMKYNVILIPKPLKAGEHIGFGLLGCVCAPVCLFKLYGLETSFMDSSWKKQMTWLNKKNIVRSVTLL